MGATPPRDTAASAGTPLPEWRLHAPWERVLLVVAALALATPGLGTLAGLGSGWASIRNDVASPLADSGAASGAWPRAVVRAFQDGFAGRDAMIRIQAVARYFALGVSPQPEVIRGEGGWLYYADDGGLEDAISETPFTTEALGDWARTLQRTQDWLEARGVTYVFLVAPDKPQIYPEHLPASLVPQSTVTRADALVAYLRAHTTVHVLDPRPGLREAKAQARLYHVTDSHWNDLGARIAARDVVTELERLSPSLDLDARALDLAAFEPRARVADAMDLARMLRLETWLHETRLELVPKVPRVARVVEPADVDPEFGEGRVVTERPDGRGPRALVYRDSFGSGLIPFLAESFSRAVFLWEYDVDPDTVVAEQPNVVIHEWTSRRLHTRAPYDLMPHTPARQQ